MIKTTENFMENLYALVVEGQLKMEIIFMMQEMDFVKIVLKTIKRKLLKFRMENFEEKELIETDYKDKILLKYYNAK